MKRTVAENFDLLLDIAGRGGRGSMLYGESLHLLHRVFEEALLSGANPAVYVEIPLSGKPYVVNNGVIKDKSKQQNLNIRGKTSWQRKM